MQKRNYSRELDRIVEENRAVGRVPTLLLHACCAPCSSACLERLREDFLVTVYYYNPNITEAPEYEKRKAEEKRLIEEYNRQVRDQDFVFHKPVPQGSVKTGSSGSYSMYSTSRAHRIEILEAPYDPESFLAMAKGLENVPEGGERCFGCYALRLRRTADAARKYGFDYFSTTLTISPLKNADKLNEIRISRRKTDISVPLNSRRNLIFTVKTTAAADSAGSRRFLPNKLQYVIFSSILFYVNFNIQDADGRYFRPAEMRFFCSWRSNGEVTGFAEH